MMDYPFNFSQLSTEINLENRIQAFIAKGLALRTVNGIMRNTYLSKHIYSSIA